MGFCDLIMVNFFEDDEGVIEFIVVFDGWLLERFDEYKCMFVLSIWEFDKILIIFEVIVILYWYEMIGNNVCYVGGWVVESFKFWIFFIELIDLLFLGNSF